MLKELFKRMKKTKAPMAKRIGTEAPKKRMKDPMPWEHNEYKDIALRQAAAARTFQKPLPIPEGSGMDAAGCFLGDVNAGLNSAFVGAPLSTALVSWYGMQGFIGHQLAATMAQHWLISKCCLMPAKDATRNGYDVKINEGSELAPEVTHDILEEIKRQDVRYQVNKNLIEFVQMGRVFGIRIAMFIVDVDDPDTYYENPFNPDAVTPDSYRGITQIDPYWIVPLMDTVASIDPASKHFYEPTWWTIGSRKVHRTHLVIYKTEEVADVLKPTYLYGGIPIPQKIYERVYAAERVANEAPLLAMSKRLTTYKTDTAMVANAPTDFVRNIEQFAYMRDNHGIKVIGLDEEISQHETALTDLDDNIMTQYQIVAAAANVPAVKLLGTTPKGFNATGEFEEANYHEELESIQTHDLTPLLERHHLLVILSDVLPKFNVPMFTTSVAWNTLDAMTAREQAEVNKLNAETGAVLVASGAIDGQDERKRLINDPDSGYTGLVDMEPADEWELGDDPEALMNEEIPASNIGA